MEKSLTYIYLFFSILSTGCSTRDHHLYSLSTISGSDASNSSILDREKNKADRRTRAQAQVDRRSSTISVDSGYSVISIFDTYESTIASFDHLSTEEKTESLLAAIGENSVSIYYPICSLEEIREKQEIDRKFASMKAYGYDFSSSPQKDIFSLVITNSEIFNILKERIKDLQLASFENYKLGMDILVRYDNGEDRLLHHENIQKMDKGIFMQQLSDLWINESDKKQYPMLRDRLKAIEQSIKVEEELLHSPPLMDATSLTKKIKKNIGRHYNAIVSEENRFTSEEINRFCNKIRQYKTYSEFKKYFDDGFPYDDFSETVYLSHRKSRYLRKLKRFILSINPDINASLEKLKKLKAEKKILDQNICKGSYIAKDTAIEHLVLSQGYAEMSLLEDFELQEGDVDKPIEKVCLLVYADAAICHACTNAIPKMQNLLSTKFQNLGVELDPSSIDIIYIPITKAQEAMFDRRVVKKIR